MSYTPPNTRDRIVWRLANAILYLATPQYRAFIKGAIIYGLQAAERDIRDGNVTARSQFPDAKHSPGAFKGVPRDN